MDRIANALAICLLLAAAALSSSPIAAQTEPSYEELRVQAFKLFDQNRHVDALPLLEKLAEMNPTDQQVLGKLAFSRLLNAAALSDPEARRKERIRAREVALKLKEMGAPSGLWSVVLDVPEDGSEQPLSPNKQVDDIMREAEAAFARGDFDAAVDGYLRALAIEPNYYEAALFIGDVYFKQKRWDDAGPWFARAIQINPDRETAHRYWGDALLSAGHEDDALERFIEAIVAEPYNRYSYYGARNYAQHKKVQVGNPRIQSPNSVRRDGDKTTLTVDPAKLESKDGSIAWLVYDMTRSTWPSEKFQQAYPDEKTYRHSLKEEVAALSVVVTSLREQMASGTVKEKDLDPALSVLLTMEQKGLLEAYILIGRADQGIAQDYEAYRKDNRDKLRRYLREYFFHAASP